jgi:hypothetical protein
MSKWIACGSVSNPKKSKEFIKFYSKLDYATQEEAEGEAQLWRDENRYAFIWVEKVGA